MLLLFLFLGDFKMAKFKFAVARVAFCGQLRLRASASWRFVEAWLWLWPDKTSLLKEDDVPIPLAFSIFALISAARRALSFRVSSL